MKRILAANGIKYVELEFLVDWHLDGERRKKSDELRTRLLAIAEIFGARNIKVGPGLGQDVHHPRPEELVPDIPRMQEAFAVLCRDAAKHGTAIVLEVMPFGNVRTIAAGRAIVEGANQPNGGLLLDIWHMGRGGIDYSEVAAIPHRFISSIELDDADEKVVGSLWEDTIHHRRLPGKGYCIRRGLHTERAEGWLSGSMGSRNPVRELSQTSARGDGPKIVRRDDEAVPAVRARQDRVQVRAMISRRRSLATGLRFSAEMPGAGSRSYRSGKAASTQRLFGSCVGAATPARTISVHRFVKAWRDERVRVPVQAYVR